MVSDAMQLGQCDCCNKPATRVMNSKNCQWCAYWYVAELCDTCFEAMTATMKEVVEQEMHDK